MRIRLISLVLVTLLVPATARADDHWADLYAAFSFGGGGSKLAGFHEAFAKGQLTSNEKLRRLSAVLSDLSVHFGSSDSGADVTQVTFLFGGRYTASDPDEHAKFSFHALVGGVSTTDGAAGDTAFASAIGAGFEYLPSPQDPTPVKGLGFRAQVDRIFRKGARDDFWRASVGVVYRIGQHK